jgi:hypothetical protein
MALWRIGLGSPVQRTAVLATLGRRYRESNGEKNGTLIRNDIVESLRKPYDAVGDPEIEMHARTLIELEPDPKYRRKYASRWKKPATAK